MDIDGGNRLAKVERDKLDFERERHAHDQWWQEDRLVNQRLTWLLTSQGVIGGGYAWLKHRVAEIDFRKAEVANDRNQESLAVALQLYKDQLITLSDWLVKLGLVVAVVIFLGIMSAQIAQYLLYCHRYEKKYRLHISIITTIGGFISALAMPVVCIVAWLKVSSII